MSMLTFNIILNLLNNPDTEIQHHNEVRYFLQDTNVKCMTFSRHVSFGVQLHEVI